MNKNPVRLSKLRLTSRSLKFFKLVLLNIHFIYFDKLYKFCFVSQRKNKHFIHLNTCDRPYYTLMYLFILASYVLTDNLCLDI